MSQSTLWIIGLLVVLFVFRRRIARLMRWLLPIGLLVLFIGLAVSGDLQDLLNKIG